MVKLPRHPGNLDLPPARVTLATGTLLWRVYRRRGPHLTAWNQFRTWGPAATAWFDHHPEPPADRGPGGPAVLYVAEFGPAAVAEAFQANRTIMRRHHAPHLVALTLARDVTLLDLCGLWPTAAGASQAIASGPRQSSRAWARAVRHAYPDMEGLRYWSSMHGGASIAVLNELAVDALPARAEDDIALADPTLTAYLDDIALSLRYRIVD